MADKKNTNACCFSCFSVTPKPIKKPIIPPPEEKPKGVSDVGKSDEAGEEYVLGQRPTSKAEDAPKVPESPMKEENVPPSARSGMLQANGISQSELV